MCHFYANPLSIFISGKSELPTVLKSLQPEHLEAVRILPSFQKTIETYLGDSKVDQARILLESDEALIDRIQLALETRQEIIANRLRTMHVLNEVSCFSGRGPIDRIDMYVKAFSGQFDDSDLVKDVLESLKYITSDGFIGLTRALTARNDHESLLDDWPGEEDSLLSDIIRIRAQVENLKQAAEAEGKHLRTKYSMQNKTLRTTVVAQKVQLSKEESALSKFDVSYTLAIENLVDLLENYFKCGNPQDMFLHEAWLYDAKSPHREVFAPKPRFSIERALSSPHDYLGCTCCRASEEGLSSSQPPTAILYQLYLESGGLINVFDLWSAFYAIIGDEEGGGYDERDTLVLFYKALADLKILGLVKHSRKKTDHLAKLAWKGL
jgi:origin recognition complex subunit 3